MRYITAMIALTSLFVVSGTLSHAQGKKWVVAIGIDNYRSKDIAPLRNAVKDAKVVAQALALNVGVPSKNVFILTSDNKVSDAVPSRTNILRLMDTLSRKINPSDTLFFYYSGHGIKSAEQGSFLTTVDTDIANTTALANTAIPLRILQVELAKIRADKLVTFIDANQNDPEIGKGDVPNILTEAFFQTVNEAVILSNSQRHNAAVLFASSVGQRSYPLQGASQGAFAQFLLKGLQGEALTDNQLTLNGLTSYVKKQMEQWDLKNGKAQMPILLAKGQGEIELAKKEDVPVEIRDMDNNLLTKFKGLFLLYAFSDDFELPDGGKHLEYSCQVMPITAATFNLKLLQDAAYKVWVSNSDNKKKSTPHSNVWEREAHDSQTIKIKMK